MKKLLLWCLLPLMVFGQNMLKNTGFEEKGENGMPVNWGGHCTGGSTAGLTTATSYSGQACGEQGVWSDYEKRDSLGNGCHNNAV